MKIQLVCLVMVPLGCCTAFLFPSAGGGKAHQYQDLRRARSEVMMQAAAAGGFKPAGGGGFKLSYGDAEGPHLLDTLQQKACWEKEYKAYIKRNGKQICAMSWRGYESYGRGAIFAKYDFEAAATDVSREIEMRGAIPSMYVDLGRWQESSAEPAQGADLSNLQQIIDRVSSYDPEKEFVVVFQSHGLMGADVVTPNISPVEMATLLTEEERGIIDVQASSSP